MATNALVPFEPPRQWICPGSRALVTYKGDRYGHERLFLWPITSDDWVIETPDEDSYVEGLNDYATYRKHVTGGALPDGMRQAVLFDQPLSDGELIAKIQRAKLDAIKTRESFLQKLDDSHIKCIDWNGRALVSAGLGSPDADEAL